MAAGLGEREIAEFVEDDDVEASEIVGDASLASGSGSWKRADTTRAPRYFKSGR